MAGHHSDGGINVPDHVALLAEAERNGASISRSAFSIEPVPHMGHGVIARMALQDGHCLFSLPGSCVLSESTSNLRAVLPPESWSALDHGWVRLIACMMWETELGSRSRWHAYLSSMPRQYETPMFWTSEELEWLTGTDLEARIGRQEAESDYESVLKPVLLAHPNLFPRTSQSFTLDSYHTQGSRILSRSFTVSTAGAVGEGDASDDDSDDEEARTEVVMIPLADMLNAAAGLNNAHLNETPEGYSMLMTASVQPGAQIYNTYNSPPNSELLRKYGHVDELSLPSRQLRTLSAEEIGEWPTGNPFDEVEIRGDEVVRSMLDMNPDMTASVIQPRLDWWIDDDNEDTFGIRLGEDIDEALLSFCRLLTNDDDWQRALRTGRMPKPSLTSAVAALVDRTLSHRLSRYPETLEADLLELKDSPIGRRRAGLVVRVGERRILQSARRLVEAGSRKTGLVETSKHRKRQKVGN